MKSNQKRSVGFIFLILFLGVVAGSILSQFIGAFFPDGQKPGWMSLLHNLTPNIQFNIGAFVRCHHDRGFSWRFVYGRNILRERLPMN